MTEKNVADRPVLGSVFIICAVFFVALQDALMKFISGDMVLWQIFVVRGAMVVLLLLPVWLMAYRGKGIWLKAFKPWVLLRSALFAGMYLFYFSVLPFVDIGILAAGFYTSPIFITLLSSLFLGDRVGVVGWLAVMIAFLGVAFILQPGTEGFNVLALMSLGASIFYALGALIVRSKCGDEEPMTLVVSLNVTLSLMAVVFSLVLIMLNLSPDIVAKHPFFLAGWGSIDTKGLFICLFLSIVMILGAMLIVKAYQSASPSIIAVFDYSYIVFAVIFGIILFSEQLSTMAFIGMVLIFTGGILVLNKDRFDFSAKQAV